MTLKDFLAERSFADEAVDKKHPIQAEVEKKLNKLIYDLLIKDKIHAFEDKYHILDKTYEEAAALVPEGKYDRLRFNDVEMQKFTYKEEFLQISVHCSWEVEEEEDKDRYHNITPGDTWAVKLRKSSWEEDKKTYRKFLDGDINTIINAKVGVGRWDIYRGQTFWIGKHGFKLTNDYKIVDATDKDYQNYQEYSAKQIAEWFWKKTMPGYQYYNKQIPEGILKISTDAKKKFDDSNDFAAWIEAHPEKKTRLNTIMSHPSQMGKRRI